MATQFSNTSTGDAPADPYKTANTDTEVPLADKVKDLADFLTACRFGMMTTREPTSGNLVSRCMAVAATENKGIDLLFFTNTESAKTTELSSDPHVNIAFLNPSGEWASVSGVCSIVTDRDLVKKHYAPDLKAWLGDLGDGTHDGSENDPRIGIIRVRTVTATYSMVARNIFGRAKEVVQGAMTGKVAHVNRMRELTATEVEEWRSKNKE